MYPVFNDIIMHDLHIQVLPTFITIDDVSINFDHLDIIITSNLAPEANMYDNYYLDILVGQCLYLPVVII